MAYLKKTGIVVWGHVWAYGGKKDLDEYGPYVGWAIQVPVSYDPTRYHSAKVYIRWYNFTFVPEPRQRVECTGTLGLLHPGHFQTRKDKIRILIRCWGDQVQDLGLDPKTPKPTYAQRQWGNLVNAQDPPDAP